MVCLYCPPSLHPHSSLLVAGVNQGMEGSIDSSASARLLTFFVVVILPHLIELWNIEPFRVSSLGRVFLASVYLSCRLLFLWSSRGICRRCLARSILCPPVFSDWEANREDISFSYNVCVFSFLVHTFIASLYFVDFDAALQYLLHKDLFPWRLDTFMKLHGWDVGYMVCFCHVEAVVSDSYNVLQKELLELVRDDLSKNTLQCHCV